MKSLSVPTRLLSRVIASGLVAMSVCAPVLAQSDDPSGGRLRLPDMQAITETSAWSWLETRRDSVSRNVSGIGRGLGEILGPGDPQGLPEPHIESLPQLGAAFH
jgi:hypothetical protein